MLQHLLQLKFLKFKRVIKFSDKENEIIPTIAINKKYETIFFGPLLSNRYPSGIWTAAKPKKYPPPKSPKSPADKLNSDIRLGEIVAVIALNKFEI